MMPSNPPNQPLSKLENILNSHGLSPHTKNSMRILLNNLITNAVKEKLDSLQGWIERAHLGKGFDGKDRWEHCAAEIVEHITNLKGEKEVSKIMEERDYEL